MIDALDLALLRLLDDPAAPTEVRDSDVSFEPLERTYRPTQTTVNLFLVDVQQNVELRHALPERVPSEDGIREVPPPVRVDCRYLLTTWAPTASTPVQRTADEHRLLADVLAWLARFAVLPPSVLGPRLADQPVPVRLTVALPEARRDVRDLWSAIGVAPRASFWLTALLSLDAGAAEVVGVPVADVDVRVHGRTDGGGAATAVHQVGGRVRGDLGPLAGATVAIEPLGRRVSTDAGGVYRLGPVPAGSHQLEVSAPGHRAATQTVQVPPVQADEYDVRLAPQS